MYHKNNQSIGFVLIPECHLFLSEYNKRNLHTLLGHIVIIDVCRYVFKYSYTDKRQNIKI